MSIYNAKKRQHLMNEYLKTLGIEVEDRKIIIYQREGLVFQFHIFQTNIEIFFTECFHCPLDCNKYIEFFLEQSKLNSDGIKELAQEDLLLLAQVKDIYEDRLPVESEFIRGKLNNKIHVLNFGLIGSDLMGKTTLFEMIPGKHKKVANLINSFVKKIAAFSPLRIKIYDYGTPIMENLVKKFPAPLLLDKLRHFYLYILVTDSTSQNVTMIKNQILPKIKKLSPFAAILVIANKQDLPNRLSAQLIEKILGERTYPLSAIAPQSKEIFTELLNEIILLRREQLQEYNCPFLTETPLK